MSDELNLDDQQLANEAGNPPTGPDEKPEQAEPETPAAPEAPPEIQAILDADWKQAVVLVKALNDLVLVSQVLELEGKREKPRASVVNAAIAKLEALKPTDGSEPLVESAPAEPETKLVPIFVSSKGIECITKGNSKFVYGDVNGVSFEVECDRQVLVAPEVAGALAGVASK